MSKFDEIEYKYKADHIKLSDFTQLMSTLPFESCLEVCSPDTYFTDARGEVLRFRNGIQPELTKKVKVKGFNNWVRVEVDLPLDPKRLEMGVIDKFLKILGFKENFKIHKICNVFFLKEVNYVYYVVLDEELKELGRFIEVEVNKDRVYALNNSLTGLNALETLDYYANMLKSLGLTPKNRLKKSLYEIYRK